MNDLCDSDERVKTSPNRCRADVRTLVARRGETCCKRPGGAPFQARWLAGIFGQLDHRFGKQRSRS